ncbi:Enoyl-CoA hydratase/isomerase [Candidatus Zixiibacteriota bacterium]|nr:Enoyl-CoA hydratase/isomerase [candidate division Zixibacteria bacterium]
MEEKLAQSYKSSDKIDTFLSDHILRIIMNRPEKKNALTVAMYSKMTEFLSQAEIDENVRIILIGGAGGSFTSGNDLKDFLENPPRDKSSPVFAFMNAISQMEKPVIAAVEGLAVGIGTTMLLHCDLVYAGKNSKFLLPFVNLGLCPEAGSSFLLPPLVGARNATELLFLGEPFSAERAKELGLINGILEDSEVLKYAEQQARKLALKSQTSIRLTKAMLKRKYGQIIKDTISEEAELLMKRLASPEAAEAFAAFFEHRQADFEKFNK